MECIHLLVAYRGARLSAGDVTRSREEARLLAHDLLERAESGQPLPTLARHRSDEPYGRRHGGLVTIPAASDFGPFAALAEVAPGSFSPVIESDYGFHVIQRLA
ncbi:MAG: peptidylprolyl isomerase [Myxococcota bacterium]